MVLKLLFLGAVLVAAILFFFRGQKPNEKQKKEPEDKEWLRNTIEVNLDILQRELETLKPIAEAAPSTPAVETARRLLREADACAQDADWQVSVVRDAELPPLLTQVFQAMSRATDARRILGACTPANLE